MNWKRFFRIRHFIKCTYFAIRDEFISRGTVGIVPKTMLIVRLEAIGDYILVRNFLSIVKSSGKFHDFHITLCGNVIWKDIAERFDKEFIDNFIWVDKKKLALDLTYRKSLFMHIFQQGFEYAVQPNFSREFLWGDSVIKASNATYRIGSVGDNANDLGVFKWISDRWFTTLIKKNAVPIFEFDRNKIFFEVLLNEKVSIKKPTFNLPNFKRIDSIILFPGAGEKQKQWSVQNFGKFIREFRKKFSNPIYICGSKQDISLANEIIKYAIDSEKVINYCGNTTLPQLIEFINEAALLITNDSSALHIGAALDTPTVCLLSGRHYGRFAPYPKGTCLNLITLYPKRFQSLIQDEKKAIERTRFGSSASIDEIKVEEVMSATIHLLA
ncbi:MAG: glycosyltransferase family 9 protein [Bacteroidota bacterium]|nr:glycosyltransferase family 9 protein [Bacteroidota bacterium]